MVNITEAVARACQELSQMKSFDGLSVVTAKTQSIDERLSDARLDGLPEEKALEWIRDYCCASFHIDTYVDDYMPVSQYTYVSFDHDKLQEKFRAWLLPFFDGDESLIPHEINLDGGDTQFIKTRPASESAIESK